MCHACPAHLLAILALQQRNNGNGRAAPYDSETVSPLHIQTADLLAACYRQRSPDVVGVKYFAEGVIGSPRDQTLADRQSCANRQHRSSGTAYSSL
jgi:hypothetical protein